MASEQFLLTYWSTAHSTTRVTPSFLFLKREVRTRFDLLRPDDKSRVFDKQLQQKSDHDHHSRARQFLVGDLVMTKNFQPGADWVAATVFGRLDPLSYLLETFDKILWRRHADHIKGRVMSPLQQPSSQHKSRRVTLETADDPEPPSPDAGTEHTEEPLATLALSSELSDQPPIEP